MMCVPSVKVLMLFVQTGPQTLLIASASSKLPFRELTNTTAGGLQEEKEGEQNGDKEKREA